MPLETGYNGELDYSWESLVRVCRGDLRGEVYRREDFVVFGTIDPEVDDILIVAVASMGAENTIKWLSKGDEPRLTGARPVDCIFGGDEDLKTRIKLFLLSYR